MKPPRRWVALKNLPILTIKLKRGTDATPEPWNALSLLSAILKRGHDLRWKSAKEKCTSGLCLIRKLKINACLNLLIKPSIVLILVP